MRMPARIVVERSAPPKLDADVAIAAERPRARQDEIAEPAETGERFAAAAHRARQPRDLHQAARDERRERVVPETKRLHHARSDRDDVLQRTRRLRRRRRHRTRRAGRMDRASFPAPAARRAASDEAATSAVGSRRATSAAKLGPDNTTTGCAPCVSSVMTSDIRASVSVSMPLVALTSTAPAGRCGAAERITSAKSVRRHRHDD